MHYVVFQKAEFLTFSTIYTGVHEKRKKVYKLWELGLVDPQWQKRKN